MFYNLSDIDILLNMYVFGWDSALIIYMIETPVHVAFILLNGWQYFSYMLPFSFSFSL